MNKFGEKAVSLILKQSLAIITITLFISIIALIFIPRIRFDNSVEAFFDKKSKSYIDFQEWKKEFGDDQVIMAAFSDEDIFTEDNLQLISRLTERFESLEYAHDVRSLTTVNDIIGSESDFIVKRLIENIPSERPALLGLKKRALENPLYLKNVISEDGKTAAIIVELEHSPALPGDAYKRETTEAILKIMKEEFPKDKNYYISGPTALEFFYTTYMRKDLMTFLPLVFLLITVILLLSFRTMAGFLLPLLAISISLVATMFFLYILGFSINNITTIIPPIMLAIVVADSVHFVGRISNKKKVTGSGKSALIETIEELAIPCFLTSFTTTCGFLSLIVSKVPPIREVGLVVGVGVILAFFITFTFMPAVIKRFNLFRPESQPSAESAVKHGKRPHLLNKAFDRSMVGLAGFLERFTKPILILTAALAIFSFWGLSRIRVDTNVLDYFKKDSFIYKSTMFIDKNLSGTNFLEISLKAEERDYFKEPDMLRKIEKLETFLSEMPEVDKTTSIVEYIKEMNKSFNNENADYHTIPESRKLVSQYLLLYGASDLNDFIDSEWKWATVRVRLNERSGIAVKRVLERIEDYLEHSFPQSSKKELLGWPVLDVETNSLVTKGQMQSLGLAMLIIFAMMFVVFRSFSIGLISIIPNAFPILINFGIMGVLGIRLDSATSMISAVGIGIIVDDTIHFIHDFKEKIRDGGNYPLAIERVLLNKGRPIILTSVILFFGFGILAFSNFMPTFYFGALSASLMFTALLGDLVILPALILYFKPR